MECDFAVRVDEKRVENSIRGQLVFQERYERVHRDAVDARTGPWCF